MLIYQALRTSGILKLNMHVQNLSFLISSRNKFYPRMTQHPDMKLCDIISCQAAQSGVLSFWEWEVWQGSGSLHTNKSVLRCADLAVA